MYFHTGLHTASPCCGFKLRSLRALWCFSSSCHEPLVTRVWHICLLTVALFLQVAEAILEWSAGSAGEVGDDQTPSPAELCSATDAEGKTAFVFAKENVSL